MQNQVSDPCVIEEKPHPYSFITDVKWLIGRPYLGKFQAALGLLFIWPNGINKQEKLCSDILPQSNTLVL